MNTDVDLFDQASDAWDREDFETAFLIFHALSMQGDVNAYANLGVLYEQGMGTARDIDQAIYWYKKAWRCDGQTSACSNLADLYQKIGNRRAALYWWKKAVAEGDGEAALDLAKTYLARDLKVSRDKAKSLLQVAVSSDVISSGGREEAEHLLAHLR